MLDFSRDISFFWIGRFKALLILTMEKSYTILGKERAWLYTEDALQTRCIGFLRLKYRKKIFFHAPNGGNRNVKEAKKFKSMGVLPGVSDIMILNRCRGYSGLAIELKKKGGRLRDSQKDFLNKCAEEGYKCAVVYNFDAFMDLVDWYFNKDKFNNNINTKK